MAERASAQSTCEAAYQPSYQTTWNLAESDWRAACARGAEPTDILNKAQRDFIASCESGAASSVQQGLVSAANVETYCAWGAPGLAKLPPRHDDAPKSAGTAEQCPDGGVEAPSAPMVSSYFGDPSKLSDTCRRWLSAHAQTLFVEPGKAAALPPGAQSLVYLNLQDIDERQPVMGDLARYAQQMRQPLESAFYHFTRDTPVPLKQGQYDPNEGRNRYQSLKEDRFFSVGRGALKEPIVLKSFTALAYGDGASTADRGGRYGDDDHVKSGTVRPCVEPEQLGFYIASTGRFRQVDFNFDSSAGALPDGAIARMASALEYWNGRSWSRIKGVTSGRVNGAVDKSGRLDPAEAQLRLTFDPPPADWKARAIGQDDGYWIRLNCAAIDKAGVKSDKLLLTSKAYVSRQYDWLGVSAVSGEKFRTDGQGSVVVPGWNPSDPGAPGASAEFESQSRVPSWYETGRWQMNVASRLYRSFAARQAAALVAGNAGSAGIFFDNVESSPGGAAWMGNHVLELGKMDKPQLEDAYTGAMAGLLSAMKAALPGKRLVINSSMDPFVERDHGAHPTVKDLPLLRLLGAVDGTWFEVSVGYKQSQRMTASYLAQYARLVKTFCARGKSFTVDADPDESAAYAAPDRNQLFALARYYLTSARCTSFSYESNKDSYVHPWRTWFGAMSYDVGAPAGAFEALADGGVFLRRFGKALVVLRPATGGAAPIPVDLGGSYRELRADGRPDAVVVTGLSLPPYKAAILVPAD